jgi:D-aminoacyl-tRNA deacylase
MRKEYMILIVSSTKDVASLNIVKQILNQTCFEEAGRFQGNPTHETCMDGTKVMLITLNEESVNAQDLTSFFHDLELVVFVSRHRSESGTPTLSVHTPGNFSSAELGGIPRKVSISPANAMRNALRAMADLNGKMQLNYEVSYECTHHGPSLDVPAMFVELGSSLAQWNDLSAAKVVAQATIETVSKFDVQRVDTVLGIGGPHYNAKFTRLALDTELAFGHMMPKYVLGAIDVDILRQCVERTLETVERVILDWKGIRSENKTGLVKMLDKLELPVERV